VPPYCGTISRGTTEAVLSQPKLPGVLACDSAASKCSSQPRKLCDGGMASSTPMYTSPSGPTVGDDDALSLTQAALPASGSVSATLARAASVPASSASRRPDARPPDADSSLTTT
jgi:hypothetical protein